MEQTEFSQRIKGYLRQYYTWILAGDGDKQMLDSIEKLKPKEIKSIEVRKTKAYFVIIARLEDDKISLIVNDQMFIDVPYPDFKSKATGCHSSGSITTCWSGNYMSIWHGDEMTYFGPK